MSELLQTIITAVQFSHTCDTDMWQYAVLTIRTALDSDTNVRMLRKGTTADCHDRATLSVTHTRINSLLHTHLCQFRAPHKHHKHYCESRPSSSVARELHTALLADRYTAVPHCVLLLLRLSRHWRTLPRQYLPPLTYPLLQESGAHYWPNSLSRLMLLWFVNWCIL